MSKFKAAVIGCGVISKAHIEAINSSQDVELYAVCDIDEYRASTIAEKHQCKCFYKFEDVLNDEAIDVIHICTPHYLHYIMAVEAMKKGKNVFTEKPMAISSAQAEDMIKVSKETGKTLGVCFQNRYNPTSQKIREVLESGKAGRILGVKASVTWHRTAEYYTESGWRGTWEKEGGGVLINQSIHTLDLLLWFLGEAEALKATVDTRMLKDVIEVEDTAEATINFKNGAVGLFYATNCFPVNSPVEIDIICENAQLKLCGDLTVSYKNGENEKVSKSGESSSGKSYYGNGHPSIIADYYKKLALGQKFPVDGQEGIKTLKAIEAIYKSNKNGELTKIQL